MCVGAIQLLIIHVESFYHVSYHALIYIGVNILHWCLQASLRGSVEISIIIQSDLWRTCSHGIHLAYSMP
jgi:hypothetical protein